MLGFDDPMSTDHHWGPRVQLFLEEADQREHAAELHNLLQHELPYTFQGYPTNFTAPDPEDHGTQLLEAVTQGPVNHRVALLTPSVFIAEYLGFDLRQPLAPADWLTFSEQRLRTLAVGGVWYDAIGLEELRSRFAYYPHDVWLYLLAAGWARIGQEEHLMGRAGQAGDEVGSALIGARLVRDLMRLCFLMERTYAPYAKWFGTAFRQLRCADALWPLLLAALHAQSWQAREEALVAAYAQVAARHNALHLTDPLPEQPVAFFGRPFRVIALHGFADALLGRITDPAVVRIAQRRPIGGLDQFSDSTDLCSDPSWRPVLRQLFV